MGVKVCYIISDITKALAFEWIHDTMDRSKVELQFILIGPLESPLISFLKSKGTPHHLVQFRSKRDMFSAWRKVFAILKKERPHVIHTHLYYANLIGLTAGWLLGIPRRIHTRHHGSLHHRYFPRAVYVDRLVNWWSTDIIVLCTRQREIVLKWENVPPHKIHLIPHGFDLLYFQSANRMTLNKDTYQIPAGAFPTIGAISRFTEWKGIEFLILAFQDLLVRYPKAHLVLANARGDYAGEIRKLLSRLPTSAYTEIEFEPDVAALYALFDVFVHVPVDEYAEAFGQTYVEALASGVPSIFTLSGIACDFIFDRKNACVVSHRSVAEIIQAMNDILASEQLRTELREAGVISVQPFAIGKMVAKLESLYTA